MAGPPPHSCLPFWLLSELNHADDDGEMNFFSGGKQKSTILINLALGVAPPRPPVQLSPRAIEILLLTVQF